MISQGIREEVAVQELGLPCQPGGRRLPAAVNCGFQAPFRGGTAIAVLARGTTEKKEAPAMSRKPYLTGHYTPVAREGSAGFPRGEGAADVYQGRKPRGGQRQGTPVRSTYRWRP
jgi:hypothetical protein